MAEKENGNIGLLHGIEGPLRLEIMTGLTVVLIVQLCDFSIIVLSGSAVSIEPGLEFCQANMMAEHM